MNQFAIWLLLAVGVPLAACESGGLSQVLEKSAQSDELRKETTVGVPLPAGCPTFTASVQAGKGLTISYEEPTADEKGVPLTNLAYTTIYLNPPNGPTQSIRVWTNDAHGGAHVTIRDIPISAQKVGVCVTATNWARKESPPATNAPKADHSPPH